MLMQSEWEKKKSTRNGQTIHGSGIQVKLKFPQKVYLSYQQV